MIPFENTVHEYIVFLTLRKLNINLTNINSFLNDIKLSTYIMILEIPAEVDLAHKRNLPH